MDSFPGDKASQDTPNQPLIYNILYIIYNYLLTSLILLPSEHLMLSRIFDTSIFETKSHLMSQEHLNLSMSTLPSPLFFRIFSKKRSLRNSCYSSHLEVYIHAVSRTLPISFRGLLLWSRDVNLGRLKIASS